MHVPQRVPSLVFADAIEVVITECCSIAAVCTIACSTRHFGRGQRLGVHQRVKVEINTREHFTELGVKRVPFEVSNPWFTGAVDVSTYTIDELLCTKMRALYQRKKGRDLFDIWYALDQGRINPATTIICFDRYMREEGRTVTRAQFEANLAQKRMQPDFRDDVGPLLRPGFHWDFEAAMDAVLESLVASLPGDPWKGADQPTE